MWFNRKYAALLLLVSGFISCTSFAQNARDANSQANGSRNRPSDTLTSDEGLSVIAAALDSRFHPAHHRDCSHLVHALYDRAGFPYQYASSSDLYAGTNEFQRTMHPQPGDLIVWKGHVGIVVSPAQRIFFSTLRNGPGIDTYDAQYWKRRGPVRFYRYIKGVSGRDGSRTK